MCANNLDNQDTKFSHPPQRRAAGGKGREIVSEPTNPGTEGGKKGKGKGARHS
jgi:hypothetical protein